MPILNKDEHKRLTTELSNRISALMGAFIRRELKSNREGCKGRTYWPKPENKCATTASDSELRLAVDDFKTILAEIRRLK